MLHSVILCGGSGTRLWPLSRSQSPKQFMQYSANEPTFFEQTFRRILDLQIKESTAAPLIICNEEYRFYVAGALQNINSELAKSAQIILEPQAKNTAPAITLAALAALECDKDAVLLILPSDHALKPSTALSEAVNHALPAAEQGFLVTFGIMPQSPQTGYGYIKCGDIIKEINSSENNFNDKQQVCYVSEFIEKPPLADAEHMLEKGGYLWNSGMFLFRADAYLAELKKYMPDVIKYCKQAWKQRLNSPDFIRPNATEFANCPPESIDYAVMEKTNNAAVLPFAVQWNDMGSWESFYELDAEHKDEFGNVCRGDVFCLDTVNSYIHSEARLVATLGIENIVIVETADAVLVSTRQDAQKVKDIANALQKSGRKEAILHQKVYRPWGYFESLGQAERFQVKRIMVYPGAELSLQKHFHRAEHWVVVSGTAEITKDAKTFILVENQSTYIAQGEKHRLKNPGMIPLILIEIQSGSYLGEDDIVRFEDSYGRIEKA